MRPPKYRHTALSTQIEEIKWQFCKPYIVVEQTSHSEIFLHHDYKLEKLLADSSWVTKDINQIVHQNKKSTADDNALGWAFSEKYDNIDDARSLVKNWEADLRRAIAHLNPQSLRGTILHIGCDPRFETQVLHDKAAKVILSDISPRLLNKAKSVLKPFQSIQTPAEKLSGIRQHSIDLYIALRVLCSANLNVPKAIGKAAEKLKLGGSMLISVSNGYKAIDNTILPGQIDGTPPRLNLSQPFDQAYEIIACMHQIGFKELFLVPSSSEIFIGGTYLPYFSDIKVPPILHIESLNNIPINYYSENMPTAWLGNFSKYEFTVDVEKWPTVEHFFQCKKFTDANHQEAIKNIPDPAEAKKYAWDNHSAVVNNWTEIRTEVMEKALLAKFSQHKNLQNILKETSNRELIETSPQDDFWGRNIEGIGKNMMGELLMKTRRIFS